MADKNVWGENLIVYAGFLKVVLENVAKIKKGEVQI
jgi:hypothetical protein